MATRSGGVLAASISLGRLAGIPVGLHYSWFIIAALITFSLSAHFRTTYPGWQSGLIWAVSGLTAVLFFVSLLAHEFSHAIVAKARGLSVRSVTLFALGGVAQIEKDANSARTEFVVAVVGPVTSLIIGFVSIAVARSMGWSLDDGAESVLGAMLGWLGSINVLLAVFNLLPGYPLDGGRILRSILWGVYGNQERATRHAAIAGQIVAAVFMFSGLFQFFAGAGFGGLWLAFIGWFLLSAAQASYAQVTIDQALRDVPVADVMGECATVDASTDLQRLVDETLLRTGRRCLMVATDGRVLGLITANEVRRVERDRWSEVTVREVMRSLDSLKTVTPATSAAEAFSIMARDDVNQLPVMSSGRLEGIVTRGQIIQLLQARSELRA